MIKVYVVVGSNIKKQAFSNAYPRRNPVSEQTSELATNLQKAHTALLPILICVMASEL